MKSPFPGMDPYAEACGLWRDFHSDLISEIKHFLGPIVPPHYHVRTEERSYIVLVGAEGKKTHPFYADLGIKEPVNAASGERQPVEAPATATAEIAPLELRPFVEEEFRETFIEIYQMHPKLQLVTSIEVLSPSNKRENSEGWELYLRKRQAQLLGAANLVEIDLLRGGQRMPMLDPWPNSPYTLLVSRMKSIIPRCHVWPAFSLRPLPTIPVPLAKPDADVPLNLQPMIEAIYERSRYFHSIDYSKPLDLPASAEEIAWMQEHLQKQPG